MGGKALLNIMDNTDISGQEKNYNYSPFYFPLVVLGLEITALHLPGRHFTT
jgi:hypothetical protein